MSQLTTNTTAFIEAQQYSQFILDNLHDTLLPEGFWRDVSDFGSGTTLNIKTVGTVTLQDAAEDVPLVYNPIDTGTITLTITDYVGEQHETRFLATGESALTALSATGLALVNGRPHRWIGGGSGVTTRVMSLSDFIAMKLAFDKAGAPAGGRIAIVDPIVEATLNSLTNIVNVSNNPMFEGIVTSGFTSTHRFVKNIFGWDVWTSNYLPQYGAVSAINASSYGLANTSTAATDVANVFMCVADDSCKPVMHAWRRMPKTEGWRSEEDRSDKFQVTSRFGFGAQRLDTLGVIYTTSLTY